jgi:putative acetyltransferase
LVATVTIESPLQDDVRALIAELNEHLLPLSPLEFQFKMSVEQMAAPDTTVFVARLQNGEAVGVGAIKLHDSQLAEVKRMFTRPKVRGQCVGVMLLDAIVGRAQELGVTKLVLETGTGSDFEGAWRLYENCGFTKCGAVLDYPDSEHSAFFERELTVEA